MRTLDVRRRCWRIISPRWSSDPLSGEGAARYGGRWNRLGSPALYLAETIETAFAEYQQVPGGTRPGLFVAFEVEADAVVDLVSIDGRAQAHVSDEALFSPWRDLVDLGHEPFGWRLHDRLYAGHVGLRAPSVQSPGGVNLVLWRWNEAGAPRVRAVDPRSELPGSNFAL